MDLILEPASPFDPDIAALLAEREAYLQGLYPDRAGLRRAVEGAAQVLGFYGLRDGGGEDAVGCAGLIRHPGFAEAKQVFVTARARGQGAGSESGDTYAFPRDVQAPVHPALSGTCPHL